MAGSALMRMPEKPVNREISSSFSPATTALSALALTAARAHDVPKVATGFVANVICSETFVSGLDPAGCSPRPRRRCPAPG